MISIHEERGIEKGIARGSAIGKGRGVEKGIALGEARGMIEGKRNRLLKVLRRKFGELPETVTARIEAIASKKNSTRFLNALWTRTRWMRWASLILLDRGKATGIRH